uniref:Uncharacterized protein n=1 Tax=Octopus bimaculoides TaxID=37653 RepID=A0A0L8GBY0_OCTBM
MPQNGFVSFILFIMLLYALFSIRIQLQVYPNIPKCFKIYERFYTSLRKFMCCMAICRLFKSS